MNCRQVERWLDRGVPEGEREGAMRHVAICGACSEAFEAASAVEAALRAGAATGWAAPAAAAPPAPEFVANVMARVAAAESLVPESHLKRRRRRVWISLATDPLSVVSITAALMVAVWSARNPSWFLDAGMNLAARWWSAAALVPQGRVDVDPLLWAGIAIAAAPLALWGGWALYRRVERAVLLLAARPGV